MKSSLKFIFAFIFIISICILTIPINYSKADSGFDYNYDSGGSSYSSSSSSSSSGSSGSSFKLDIPSPYDTLFNISNTIINIFLIIFYIFMFSKRKVKKFKSLFKNKYLRLLESIFNYLFFCVSMFVGVIITILVYDSANTYLKYPTVLKFISFIIFYFVCKFILVFIFSLITNRFANYFEGYSNEGKVSEDEITKLSDESIKLKDSSLNNKDFINKIFNLYKNVQDSWMNFDYDNLRKYLSDELYNNYYMQLETLKLKNGKNIMADIEFIDGYITDIKIKNNIEEVIVIMDVSQYDYIINTNTNKVIRGTDDIKHEVEYRLTLERSIGSIPSRCPNCDAKISKKSSSIVCQNCSSILVKPSSDFILVKKEVISQD